MSARELEAALAAPDGDVSIQTFWDLTLSKEPSTDALLPTVAETYLKAFCNGGSSSLRRRFVGVALRKMIRTSSDVANHLKALRADLLRLGQVILSSTELEQTKIIAGLLIREAIEQGIGFPNFWSSRKVPDNAPNFPCICGPKWMNDFQTFLDTLADLRLVDTAMDSAILYPVSIVASDDFKSRYPNDASMVAIIESRVLTVVTNVSDEAIDFVDIPLVHVKDVYLQKSNLNDSQAQGTMHEPWDLVLSFHSCPWTYRVNASEHTGDELKILFPNFQEAKECDSCIKEVLDPLGQRKVYSTTPIGMENKVVQQSISYSSKPIAMENKAMDQSNRGVHSEIQPGSPGVKIAESLSKPRDSFPVDASQSRKAAENVRATQRPAPTGLDPRTTVQVSSTIGFVDDQHSNLVLSKKEEIQVEAERSDIISLKSAAVPEPDGFECREDIAQESPVIGGNQKSKVDFPEEFPRIVRPSKVDKKRTQIATPNPTVTTPRVALNGIKKIKSNGSRPKSTQQLNDIENEEDQTGLELIQSLSSARKIAYDTLQVTQSQVGEMKPRIPLAKAKSELKSLLPNVSKLLSQRTSLNQMRQPSDPFAIPQDEEPDNQHPRDKKKKGKPPPVNRSKEKVLTIGKLKAAPEPSHQPTKKRSQIAESREESAPDNHPKGKLRARRQAAQDVNYKDGDSSESERSDQDYVEDEQKRTQSAPKATTQRRVVVPKRMVKARPKPKTGGNKAANSNGNNRPISPHKHRLLAMLTNPHVAQIDSVRDNESRPKGVSQAPNHLKEMVKTVSSPLNNAAPVPEDWTAVESKDDVASSNSRIHALAALKENTSPLEEHDSDVFLREFVHPDEPHHGLNSNSFNYKPIDDAAQNESQIAQKDNNLDIPSIHPATVKSTLVSMSQKRSAEDPPPSTPFSKRAKNDCPAGQSNMNPNAIDSLRAPTTIAPLRLLNDPPSPLDHPSRALSTIRRYKTHVFGSNQQQARRHTPLHQYTQRIHSSGSVNTEILSSNSKPIPASPHAESKAISGHADQNDVNLEKELGDHETARNNPFARRSNASKLTAFTRRLTEEFSDSGTRDSRRPEVPFNRYTEQAIDSQILESPLNMIRTDPRAQKAQKALGALSTPIRVKDSSLVVTDKEQVRLEVPNLAHPQICSRGNKDSTLSAPPQIVDNEGSRTTDSRNYDYGEADADGDETLVAPEQETPFSLRASSPHFRSSPPGNYPPSSHSSTSAEPDPVHESETQIPTSEFEEMEWEASLQPHQRDIHDQLIRVSKSLVCHIIDKETAVDDIAETYANDGEHLLNSLVERHSRAFESVLQETEQKKSQMRNEYEQLAKRMARERSKYGPNG